MLFDHLHASVWWESFCYEWKEKDWDECDIYGSKVNWCFFVKCEPNSSQFKSVAAGATFFWAGTNKLKVQAIWSKLLDPFFLHLNDLWTGIFVKIKPNFLSSGDIALASTLISTCLSTDELLLSGMRVVENGPITWGQTYKNNIDSL